eukprot:549201-Pelagomonas_calceolata.AAC.2
MFARAGGHALAHWFWPAGQHSRTDQSCRVFSNCLFAAVLVLLNVASPDITHPSKLTPPSMLSIDLNVLNVCLEAGANQWGTGVGRESPCHAVLPGGRPIRLATLDISRCVRIRFILGRPIRLVSLTSVDRNELINRCARIRLQGS